MSFPLWPALRRIALIAPAGVVDDAALDECLSRLAALGIEAVAGDNVAARHRYLAGHVEARLDDLYQAYQRPGIDAVWCLRGGYGCAQLLGRIDWSRLATAATRPLIGYSDISALLLAFADRGLAALHGALACEVNALDLRAPAGTISPLRWQALASVATVLSGAHGGFPTVHPVTRPTHGAKAPSGRLVGGNLTVLASLCGTPAALKLETPSLLLLEDVGEPLYRLERSFFQLLESLDKRKLHAVCLGEFSRCSIPSGAASIATVFAEWLAPHGIPLYAGLPIGHGEHNLAWPWGAAGHIDDAGLHWDRPPWRAAG